MWKGVFLVTLGLLFSLVASIFSSQYEFRVSVAGMRVGSALSNAIYRKALHLSGQARAKYTTGEIVNMMSVDTQRSVKVIGIIRMPSVLSQDDFLCTAHIFRQIHGPAEPCNLLVVHSSTNGHRDLHVMATPRDRDSCSIGSSDSVFTPERCAFVHTA